MNLDLIDALFKINAIHLNFENPYTWSSGIKSPIYCDNRKIISYPKYRQLITQKFQEIIIQNNLEQDFIAGTATAGIPHAAWLAGTLNLPLLYVRAKAKEKKKKNQIEGDISQGKSALLIEDLISTAGSSLNASFALREAGIKQSTILAIVTYSTKKSEILLKENNLALYSLIDRKTILHYISQQQAYSESDLQKLKDFFIQLDQ